MVGWGKAPFFRQIKSPVGGRQTSCFSSPTVPLALTWSFSGNSTCKGTDSSYSSNGSGQSGQGYGDGNYRNMNTTFSFFLPTTNPCMGSAPQGATWLCGPAPAHSLQGKIMLQLKQSRKENSKKRKVKHFLLYVQCSEKKKINEISNKGPGESAGRKTLQTITRNLNSARRRKKKKKTCSNSCFIAYFVSERTKRVCQGCGRRFTVMTGSRGKSGFFLWMTGKRHDRKKLLFSLDVSHYSLTLLPQANILHIDTDKSELWLQYNILLRYSVLMWIAQLTVTYKT